LEAEFVAKCGESITRMISNPLQIKDEVQSIGLVFLQLYFLLLL